MNAKIIAAALALAVSAGMAYAEPAPSSPATYSDNWESEARQFAKYAFGGLPAPAGLDLSSTGSIGPIDPDYIPYLGGVGDPLGLTSSSRLDSVETGEAGQARSAN
jgi:hypothetical protein